jgi:hypothetical protein
MRLPATIASVLALSACGGMGGIGGGSATLRYETEYAHRVTGDSDIEGIGTLGLSARGSAGGADLGYLAGIDLHFGATAPLGFAYDAALYLGGIRLTTHPFLLGIGTGIGVSGSVETRDDAMDIPVELAAELSLGSHARIMHRARTVWLLGSTPRQAGAPEAPFADEAHADLVLRLGPSGEDFGFEHGRGYFLGITTNPKAPATSASPSATPSTPTSNGTSPACRVEAKCYPPRGAGDSVQGDGAAGVLDREAAGADPRAV